MKKIIIFSLLLGATVSTQGCIAHVDPVVTYPPEHIVNVPTSYRSIVYDRPVYYRPYNQRVYYRQYTHPRVLRKYKHRRNHRVSPNRYKKRYRAKIKNARRNKPKLRKRTTTRRYNKKGKLRKRVIRRHYR